MLDEKPKKAKKNKENNKETLGPSNGVVKPQNARINRYGNQSKKKERET